MKILGFLLFLAVMLVAGSSYTANAQKLPKIQEASVWAPDNIKIDGKLTEWKDQLQAYNTPNLMYYTISNDDKNLYLTIRMKGGLGGRKAFRGGITFRISPSSKNTDDISVTYPAMYHYVYAPFNTWDSPIGLLTSTPSEERYARLYGDTVANKREVDDLVSNSNKTIKATYKDIHVVGIKEISDELISVYNEAGIKVDGVFNPLMEYTYELALPLKYLGDEINQGNQFKYNIKLNVGGTLFKKGEPIPSAGSGGRFISNGLVPAPSAADDYFNYSTDFSGRYTLAKKKL